MKAGVDTGALGVRTIHQKDAKAQLVLHVQRPAASPGAAAGPDSEDSLATEMNQTTLTGHDTNAAGAASVDRLV